MYICDFVEVIKMCKFKLYKLYHDPKCKFGGEAFNTFHSLLIGNDDGFPLIFVKSPIDDDDWCITRFNSHQVLDHSWEQITRVALPMNPTFYSKFFGFVQL
jgi:hypothetical protein